MAAPTQRPVQFDAVAVLLWREGQFTRKDTYIDAIGLQAQLAGNPQPAAA